MIKIYQILLIFYNLGFIIPRQLNSGTPVYRVIL
jgi:hypothetical protein